MLNSRRHLWIKAKGRCHNCHELGHYRFECPALVKKSSGTSDTSDATTRTIASDEKKKRLMADQRSTSIRIVVQKTSDQPQLMDDRSSMGDWLDVVRRCPLPSFPVGAPQLSETTTWNRQTPSGLWKNNGSTTQHAQQSTQHAQQSTRKSTANSSTQHAQQSTQHAQQLPEAHPNWSTQHTQQSTQHAQQSTQHANHLLEFNYGTKENSVLHGQNTGTLTQHAPQLTQHAQHSQETLQHAVESELPTRAKREESSPGNKTCKAGNTLFIEVKIGKRRCPALLDTGSEVTLLPKHLANLSQLNRSSRTSTRWPTAR